MWSRPSNSLIGSDRAAKGTEGVVGKGRDEKRGGLEGNDEVEGLGNEGFGGGWRELLGKF